LPDLIDELEARQAELNEQINDADFYKNDKETIAKALSELEKTTAQLEQVYERWNELEALAG
jgi:ATP-binding cassette subfamily F protein uup